MKCVSPMSCFTLLFLVLFSCATTWAANATLPALVNGNFKQVDAQGQPVGWKVVSGATFQNVDGSQVLQLKAEKSNASIVQHMTLDPTWGTLRFRYRVKVDAITPGELGWHNARIALSFSDAKGAVTHLIAGEWKQPTAGWVDVNYPVTIPADAVKVGISPAIFNATGSWMLADLRVELIAHRGEGIDATLPNDQAPTWGKEPVEIVSPLRGQICLNGLWKFMPALGETGKAPATQGWGYIWVPGDWTSNGANAGLAARGSGTEWDAFNKQSSNKAWYERPLMIPAEWKNRTISLELQRVSTDAKIYVNGTECGPVAWPTGTVDITSAVKFGQENQLRILVVAAADEGDLLVFMGNATDQVSKSKATLRSRGLIGDVIVSSRPRGAYVSDVFVIPSTRQKKVTVQSELRNVTKAGKVQVTASMINDKGEVEKQFTSQANVQAAATQTIELSWPWADARLWDIGQPNLYTVQWKIQGSQPGVIDDQYAQTFGFREFWIEGTRFMLNGTELRLRPIVASEDGMTTQAIDSKIQAYQRVGFNIAELWPDDYRIRSTYNAHRLWIARASRLGFPVMAISTSMARYLQNVSGQFTWDQPGKKEAWFEDLRTDIGPIRNEPAILLWTSTANYFGHNDDQDPWRMGLKDKGRLDVGGIRRLRASDEGEALLKKYDPTRPVAYHAGAQSGDVYSTNHYLDFIALQEREEWLSHALTKGDMPCMSVEFGTPLYTSFMRGRNGYGKTSVSEPWFTEFAAIYQGPQAYADESKRYRQSIAKSYQQDMLWENWHGRGEDFETSPNFQKIETLFVTNTWRSWRTLGITGGMVPWASGHGWGKGPTVQEKVTAPPFVPGSRGTYQAAETQARVRFWQEGAFNLYPSGQALIDNNSDTLAWIAGAGAKREDITDKEHNFAPGQRVNKQIALLNDARQSLPYSYTCSVTLADKSLIDTKGEGRLAPAQTLLLPVGFTLPAQITGDRSVGEIRLSATIGSIRHEDKISFTIIAPPTAPATSAQKLVRVFDPSGKTTALLRSLGYTTLPWDGKATKELLIIGSTAFSSETKVPGDIEKFIEQGGRLLVMAQLPEWLEQGTGWRIARTLSRRAFPVQADHPVMQSLQADDLRDWTGSSTLVEAFPHFDPKKDKASPSAQPYTGWHWGNRGTVSTAMIEKPHRAGWRAILEGEFDLAYSPLMELDYGQGRMIWCQLDLEDHASLDPAARRLSQQLVQYAQTSPLAPRAKNVIYLGGATGQALLKAVGVNYREATSLSADTSLAIIGTDAKITDAQLRAYLQSGGKIFFLPQNQNKGWLDTTLEQVTDFAGSMNVPAWNEAHGLSVSDLHRRADGPAWLLRSGEVGADGLFARYTLGSGVAIACQLDPLALPVEKKFYLHFTRWRQLHAVTQTLANLGASFTQDARIFRWEQNHEIALAGQWQYQITLSLPSAPSTDKPVADPGVTKLAKTLLDPQTDDANWKVATMPAMLPEFEDVDGEAVLRREVIVPESWSGQELVLSLGSIDDFDEAYFNGTPIGHTGKTTPAFWMHPRVYAVPANLVHPGKNVLTLRMFDQYGSGGFNGPAYKMTLTPKKVIVPEGLYSPDFIEEYGIGDNPYRYYRW